MTDVTPAALMRTRGDDEFTRLVLSAPTVDITNLDTSKLTTEDNVEYFKQEVVVSCKDVFTVAHEALRNKPNLAKVIVVEHAPRFDEQCVDPISLKPALAKFANTTFNNLWMESAWKSQIHIASHNLQCDDKTRLARYTDQNSKRYDGVHMYGQKGKQAYTRNLVNILNEVFATPNSARNNQKHVDEHSNCPQTQFQHQMKYSVPVRNRFNILGN